MTWMTVRTRAVRWSGKEPKEEPPTLSRCRVLRWPGSWALGSKILYFGHDGTHDGIEL